MSDASIATSVPVPMARPRSAWASAGASLTPSPTMATTRPSRLQAADDLGLAGGQDVGDDLADADLGGDRGGGRGVVARQQHGPEAERLELRARRPRWTASRRRPRRSGRARAPSQPTATTVWPCGLRRRRARPRARRRARPRSASRLGAAGDDGVALDRALDAAARVIRGTTRLRGARPPRSPRRPRWPGPPGAPRRARARRRAAAARPRSPPAAGDDGAHPHLPRRHRAGLVEHDRVDAPRRLEHLGPLDQDAELCAATRADEQRGRRGQPERARAGDDQHGDRGREREGGARRRRPARSRASPRRGRSRPARRWPRRDRRGAGRAPCRSAPRSRGGRSAPAPCRRRPSSRARRAGRRR